MSARQELRSNPAEKAEQQVKCYELKLTGMSLRAIGKAVSLSHETVRQYIALEADSRVLPLANQLRKQELDRLDQMELAVRGVLEAQHYVVSDGRVVKLKSEDGTEDALPDDEHVLKAVDRLLKIQDRRAKLLGLDAPTQVEATVHEVTQADIELRGLIQQQQARNDAAREALREQA